MYWRCLTRYEVHKMLIIIILHIANSNIKTVWWHYRCPKFKRTIYKWTVYDTMVILAYMSYHSNDLVREWPAGIRYHFQIMIIDYSILSEQHSSSVVLAIINHTFCLLHFSPDFILVMIVLLWRNGLKHFLFVVLVSSSLQGFPSTSLRTCMITSMFIMELTHVRGTDVSFYVTVWSTYSSALHGDQPCSAQFYTMGLCFHMA